jgi:hypothetical protein
VRDTPVARARAVAAADLDLLVAERDAAEELGGLGVRGLLELDEANLRVSSRSRAFR